MSVVTLLTDFGHRDWFVAAMKGVIYGIHPRARIVDITHEIDPGQVSSAAFALKCSYDCFPAGTIHVAVVDPGVGGPRAAILVRTKRYFFVGPDNGILSLALENEKILEIRRLENARYFRQPVSATFHGRDVFAPSAAHLGRGIPPSRFGPRQGGYQRLPWLSPVNKKGILHGTTVYVDRFGNVITNLPALWVRATRKYSLRVPGIRKPIPVLSFYEAAPLGSPLVLAGSHGYLEIAVNGGSAARELKIGAQTSVMLRLDH